MGNKKRTILPEESLTFLGYFKLPFSTEDVLEYFGYDKQNAILELPQSTAVLQFVEMLQTQINDHLIHISLEN
jgi:hypothetical protein